MFIESGLKGSRSVVLHNDHNIHTRKLFSGAHSRRERRQKRRLLVTKAISKEVIELLIFSAAPFVAVQAIADSGKGKAIFQRLKEEKPLLLKEAEKRALERSAAQERLPWYGEKRPTWLGPLKTDVPGYLNGTLPGDYGFDTLQLSANPKNLDRYFELELLHARWAMLGALGALVPEVLQIFDISKFPEPRWFRVGAFKLQSGEDLNYFGIPGFHVAGGQGILVIAVCQLLLMFGPEYARYCGIEALEPLGIFLPGDKNYPGGWLFDPLNLSKDPTIFEKMKVREIKNGRLAMVAWLGFAAQAIVSDKGPVQNVLDIFHP